MKILIISGIQTNPITSGTGKFIKDYCELLQEMGHEVFFLHATFYAFSKSKRIKIDEGAQKTKSQWGNHYFRYQFSFVDKLKEEVFAQYRKMCCNFFAGVDDRYPLGLARFVNDLDKVYHFDACLVNYYWFSKLLTQINIPRRGIITHDSFTYNNERNSVRSLLNLKPNEEAKALQRCPTIFAMQEEEKVLFQRYAPHSKVLTSFCNYTYVDQEITGNHNLVYLSGGFYLNVNGLKWFVNEIFPSILQAFPDCKLIIAGTLCNEIPQYRNHPNIKLLGLVDDASDLYSLGDVAINPTYQGTGLKIKTFEAMAYDKVTMVHPHSVNGIFDKANAPIFVSDEASKWVNFLQSIWGDDKSRIQDIKSKNKEYIERMNTFIESQFKEFLSL